MLTVEQLQAKVDEMFPGLMGVKILEATPECIRASMVVRPDLCTGGASIHGGAVMAFADTLGALGTVVNLPPGASTTTIESSTKFLAGAAAGTTVIGESTPFHRGRTTMVWQTLVKREDGKVCGVVTQTQLVIAAKS